MSIFYRRVWIPLRSVAAKVTKRFFTQNPRVRDGLTLINQGIETLLTPQDNDTNKTTLIPVSVPTYSGVDFGVNVAGFVKGEFGIGAGARALIMALEAIGIPYVVNNVQLPGHSYADNTVTNFSLDNPFPVNIIHVNADQSGWFHRIKGPQYLVGKRNIGWWAWELSSFPEEWLSSFRFYDEIWVPSNFVLETISKSSLVPVVKVSPCVQIDLNELNTNRSVFGLDNDSYVFLFNFDFHSFFTRKNPVALVKAFRMAFGDNKDVLLVLKYINHTYHKTEVKALMKTIADANNIKVIDKHFRRSDLYSLVACSNCYVSLHRSEGFGLTLAEAMYLGKPVIATGYSGNMDFMNVSNSFPVRYKLVELGEKDYLPFKKGYVWADPNIEHAAELMRSVYEDKQYAAEIGERACKDMKEFISPLVIGELIQNRLKRICGSV